MAGQQCDCNFSSSVGEPIKPKGSCAGEQKSEHPHETRPVTNESGAGGAWRVCAHFRNEMNREASA
jgi:hypothetical protein